MKVVGIVAEYNPFHYGHLYHLQSSRSLTEADCVVVVMSGNYTQRGEPAVVSKWARAEMALLSGADLVIELPVAYAMGSAEYFAYGAVRLLDSLGVVDAMVSAVSPAISKICRQSPPSWLMSRKNTRIFLKTTCPTATRSLPQDKSSVRLFEGRHGKADLTRLLKSSNNILGIEYLKALLRLDSKIKPVTISRIGSDYNSTELSGKFSSATSIRNILSVIQWRCAKKLIEASMPTKALSVLEREIELGRGPVFPSDFGASLISLIRRTPVDELRSLPYMEAGLENRLKLAAEKSGTYEELVSNIATRRYTGTRIQRILFSLLIGLDSRKFAYFNSLKGPSYIRILGFTQTGRQLLSSIRGKTGLPVITKTADFKTSDTPGVSEMLALENAATNQYVLGYENPYYRTSGSDFTQNVINVDGSTIK